MTVQYRVKFEDGGVTITQTVDAGTGVGQGPGDNPSGKGTGPGDNPTGKGTGPAKTAASVAPIVVAQGAEIGVILGPLVIGKSSASAPPAEPTQRVNQKKAPAKKKEASPK